MEILKDRETCTCDAGDYRGLTCHYKNGCKYDADCQYAEENQDSIINEIPCNGAEETGSRVICKPPVMDTDEDWIFDCSKEGQMVAAEAVLKKHGFWMADMSQEDYGDIRENFTPYRLGHLNFILCNNRAFYKKFVFATYLAARLNLLKKEDRIVLFQGVLYGKIDGEEY